MVLRPCSACARHVRSEETRCPFCDSPLEVVATAPHPISPKLGRAARLAFGAAVASASIACSGSGSTTSTGDAGAADTTSVDVGGSGDTAVTVDSGTDTGSVEDSNIAKPYGAPPADGLLVV